MTMFTRSDVVHHKKYNYKNCQSLFGYAASVHIRSKGKCQLCECGGSPLDFDQWRQMTVEHLIGRKQHGYLKDIRVAVVSRFPDLLPEESERLSQRLDAHNTVTACSFCNSTTSRDINEKTMIDLLNEAQGNLLDIEAHISSQLQLILERKRKEVKWKISSVKEAFLNEISPNFE
jgi:hypothetical protein